MHEIQTDGFMDDIPEDINENNNDVVNGTGYDIEMGEGIEDNVIIDDNYKINLDPDDMDAINHLDAFE